MNEIPTPSELLPRDGGKPKMQLNLVVAGISTMLALWLTIADFAYPGNLLFQDSISPIAAGGYVSILFLAILALAVLPKRIIIVSNLIVVARMAMGWPLSLVIDHSLACRILSLSLLVLSAYHLAASLNRPLLKLHLRPWLNVRHTIVAVILWLVIGMASIPAMLLGYVEASKSIMGHYVQLSWSGISLVERVFEKDDQRVHLVGMMHIGEGSFYTDLDERLKTTTPGVPRIVLTEGVSDNEDLLPAEFKSGQTYAKLAKALGLTPQNKPAEAAQPELELEAAPTNSDVTFRNADIDISALDENYRTTLVSILEMLNFDSIAELFLTQPENVSGHDIEQMLINGLLLQRNDVLMGHIEGSAGEFKEVFVPWGAAHLPDIEERLLALGFTQQEETIRPIVRFWGQSKPAVTKNPDQHL